WAGGHPGIGIGYLSAALRIIIGTLGDPADGTTTWLRRLAECMAPVYTHTPCSADRARIKFKISVKQDSFAAAGGGIAKRTAPRHQYIYGAPPSRNLYGVRSISSRNSPDCLLTERQQAISRTGAAADDCNGAAIDVESVFNPNT